MVLNKEYITLSRKGDIMQLGAIVGTYTKHIPAKRYWGGRQFKVVPYYYSVELCNGKSYSVIYSRKELKQIIHGQII